MLQPFVLLEKKYLARLVKLNKIYLVTQSYNRAYDHFANETRIDILITDYDDKGLAAMHLNAVKEDKYASIISLNNEGHKNKLAEMLTGSKYRLFWSVVQSAADLKRHLDAVYKERVRRYIEQSTLWRISGNDLVKVDGLEVTFGKLFITLKWRNQKRRINFEEIEKA